MSPLENLSSQAVWKVTYSFSYIVNFMLKPLIHLKLNLEYNIKKD